MFMLHIFNYSCHKSIVHTFESNLRLTLLTIVTCAMCPSWPRLHIGDLVDLEPLILCLP